MKGSWLSSRVFGGAQDWGRPASFAYGRVRAELCSDVILSLVSSQMCPFSSLIEDLVCRRVWIGFPASVSCETHKLLSHNDLADFCVLQTL